jgi:transposase-like protein
VTEKRRRYSKVEKVAAIVAAEASSTLAAAEESGVPRSTLRYWLDDPKFAEYRHNAREAMAEEARVVARLAWRGLAQAILAGKLEPRDLITAAGMGTDKTQLLSGGATERVEARDLTDDFDDHEKAALRKAIEATRAPV